MVYCLTIAQACFWSCQTSQIGWINSRSQQRATQTLLLKWLHLKKLLFKARDFFSCIHFKSKVESNYAQFDARSDAFAHWNYCNLKLHWVAKVWLMLKQSFCHLKDQMHISCHLKPSLEKFLFLLTSVSAVQRKYKKIITKSLNFPIFQGANLRFMTMKPALPH